MQEQANSQRSGGASYPLTKHFSLAPIIMGLEKKSSRAKNSSYIITKRYYCILSTKLHQPNHIQDHLDIFFAKEAKYYLWYLFLS